MWYFSLDPSRVVTSGRCDDQEAVLSLTLPDNAASLLLYFKKVENTHSHLWVWFGCSPTVQRLAGSCGIVTKHFKSSILLKYVSEGPGGLCWSVSISCNFICDVCFLGQRCAYVHNPLISVGEESFLRHQDDGSRVSSACLQRMSQ